MWSRFKLWFDNNPHIVYIGLVTVFLIVGSFYMGDCK